VSLKSFDLTEKEFTSVEIHNLQSDTPCEIWY